MRRSALAVAVTLVVVACSSGDDSVLSRHSVGSLDPGDDGGLDGASDGAVPGLPPPAQVDGGGDAGFDAGQTYTGDATYYAADGTGACGFPASPNDLMVAAMNKSQYAKSICGKCVFVTGPKGTVKVRIVDLCPGCSSGSLDLSEEAFAKIAALSAGRVKISWYYVPC